MQYKLLDILRCPVTKSKLTLRVIKEKEQLFEGEKFTTIESGILFSEHDWFYPIIEGIPRLCVEAFLDYREFLMLHLENFEQRSKKLKENKIDFINQTIKNNKRTKESFTKEWAVYDYEKDKTWMREMKKCSSAFYRKQMKPTQA